MFDKNLLIKELYYHPPWYNDKELFFKLLDKRSFNIDDIKTIGRLYVKYKHLSRKPQVEEYFTLLAKQANCENIHELCKKTISIYLSEG